MTTTRITGTDGKQYDVTYTLNPAVLTPAVMQPAVLIQATMKPESLVISSIVPAVVAPPAPVPVPAPATPAPGVISPFSAANDAQIKIDGASYYVENANKPYSLASPDAHTLRFELRSGDHWSSPVVAGYSDPVTSERCEVASTVVHPNGTQISLSYDFMVEAGAVNTSKWIVLGQMHEFNVSDSPPFAVELVNGDHMAINIGTRTLNYPYKDANPIQRAHWYSMVCQMKFDKVAGILNVSRDGVSIVSYKGALGTGAATYWKNGIYRSAAPETMAVNYRNLKITTG